MATKKSAIVKSVDGGDLAKAGIDVKLSKMEIADYIADKAKEELETKINGMREEIQKWVHGYLDVVPTKQQQKLADDMSALDGTNKFVVKLSYFNHGDGISPWNIVFGYEAPHWHHGKLFQVILTVKADASQIPDVDIVSMQEELCEANERLHELGKKKHRTVLLEKILAGSDSGKKVLADLQNMVNRAVNG